MADSEALTRRYIDAINARDWATVTDLLTDDAVHHYTGGMASGPGEIVSLYQMLCDQFSWKIAIQSVTTTDTWAATLHRNELSLGSFEVCTCGRFDGERIAELWTNGMPPLPS